MEVNSFIGMLNLLKAIKKTAIKDELLYRKRGIKRGKNAWNKWKKSECRCIYYNCYILIKEINNYKSRYNSIPKGRSGYES